MLGQEGEVSSASYSSATDWDIPITWSNISEPLFSRLDLDAILEQEEALASSNNSVDKVDPGHGIKGSGKNSKKEEKEMKQENVGIQYLDFDTFMTMELRTGTITSVDDHPNADKLYVVSIDDASEGGRTVCAGLKPYYACLLYTSPSPRD